MYKEIDKLEFIEGFHNSIYKTYFSNEGLNELYSYLTSYELQNNIMIHFNIIDITITFKEYDSFLDIQKDYPSIKSLQELKLLTSVIELPNNRYIIEIM